MEHFLANYHTHTKRCGHAQGEDKDFVNAAIDGGFKILGFSDHSPMIFKTGHKSWHRIQEGYAQDYFDSIHTLKRIYSNDIEIHVGVEVEYYPETFDEYLEYINKFNCEYFILGQHFIWREEDNISVFKENDDYDRLKNFFDNLISAVKTEKFLYVAHPDSLRYSGPSEIFLSEAERFIKVAKEYDIPLEVNRLGLHDNRNYPREDFWKLVSEYGNRVILGSDAHNPEALSCKADYIECYDFIKKCNLNLIENNILDIK